MQDYQQRVIQEKQELDEKISKLKDFICGDKYNTLPVSEQNRLTKQLEYMEGYSEILNERIKNFGESQQNPTDLQAFIDLYSRLGITCNINQSSETGNQFILLVECFSSFDEEGDPKPTKSGKLIGHPEYCSRIKFDKDGNFISQGFWETHSPINY